MKFDSSFLKLFCLLIQVAVMIGAGPSPGQPAMAEGKNSMPAADPYSAYLERCRKEIGVKTPSPAAELFSTYLERCRTEIGVLSAELDELNSENIDRIPKNPSQTFVKALESARETAPRAQKAYNHLKRVPRKYNEWAEKYVDVLEISDDVIQVKRWEGIRPVLLPVIEEKGDLGWSEPDGDDITWRENPAAVFYEMLLLFSWLSDTPPTVDETNIDLDWLKKEMSGGLVEKWVDKKDVPLGFFHDQYMFKRLNPPPLIENLPTRVEKLIHRLTWKSGADARELTTLVAWKDRFMVDLLEHFVNYDPHPIAVNWFSCGGRWFPPFTLLKPEVDLEKGLRVMEDRPDSKVKNLLDILQDRGIDSNINHKIHSAIYSHQISESYQNGLWRSPTLGWSTWTRKMETPSTSPHMESSTVRTHAAPISGEDEPAVNPLTSLAPQEAWRRICIWIVERLHTQGVDRMNEIAIQVNHDSNWILAFGEDELHERLKQEAGKATNGMNENVEEQYRRLLEIDVDVLDVFENVMITLKLDKKTIANEVFTIKAPWPGWFAASMHPKVSSGWFIYTVVLFLVLSVMLFRLFRTSRIREGNNPTDVFKVISLLAIIIGIAMFIFILNHGPRPMVGSELGGTVDFVIPTHGAISENEKKVIEKSCLALFRILSEKSMGDTKTGIRSLTWWKSLTYMISPKRIPEAAMKSESGDGFHVDHLGYKLTPVRWSRNIPEKSIRGRIIPADQEKFSNNLTHIVYRGEPDAPDFFISGPDSDVTFALVFYDGNHGSLAPPESTRIVHPPPTLVVWPPTPTRDGNPERVLEANARLNWIQTPGSKSSKIDQRLRVVSLMDGYGAPLKNARPQEDLDVHKARPSDLEAYYEKLWRDDYFTDDKIEKTAAEIAGIAMKLFRAKREKSSRTTLGLNQGIGFYLLLILGSFMIFSLVFSQQDGLKDGARKKTILLWPGISFALLLITMAGYPVVMETESWTYGRSVLAATRTIFRAIGGCIFIILVGLPFALDRIIGTDFSKMVKSPSFVFDRMKDYSLSRCLLHTLGLLILAAAAIMWDAGVIRSIDGFFWLPQDFGSSNIAALGLWFTGVLFILLPSMLHGRR